MWKLLTYFLAGFLIWQGGSAFFSDSPSTPSPNGTIAYSERRQVILFTGSDWCPACKLMESAIVEKQAWQDFCAKEILWEVVDVSRRGPTVDQQGRVKQFKIKSYPTMVLTNAAGKELDRRIGVRGDLNSYMEWIRTEQ